MVGLQNLETVLLRSPEADFGTVPEIVFLNLLHCYRIEDDNLSFFQTKVEMFTDLVIQKWKVLVHAVEYRDPGPESAKDGSIFQGVDSPAQDDQSAGNMGQFKNRLIIKDFYTFTQLPGEGLR